MDDRELTDHPEGGRYKEVFRSESCVVRGSDKRDALTHIYFSLNTDEVSRFHKVDSDEVWNLYEGDGLRLYLWDSDDRTMKEVELSAQAREYCYVVRSGIWQAAVPMKTKVLVGCSVAPGFEFNDFELIDPDSPLAGDILEHSPQLKHLVIS